ncbi:hypothetical protein HMPREF0322_03848 [Desulfitobacterium hafniense DP7]|uniref:TIGR02677 family protein n=1 Tax=Desulfitobacterium hafniense DP7 TaxID=537010 RepID=G9XS99_DESHA|nr:Wadjet anti-phage system protein JetA family protein [Desulfitobacterium hafniense]EHL05498.1 hypothetical protein HMPREF0322_03848 [Desulfitobacterium hafniense DP7]
MGLFDVVPNNFFSVLVSGNKEVYVDALMLLHQLFKFELNIRVDDYISSLISLLEDKAFVPEDDDEMPESSLTPSGKARLILNRFVKTGWVDKEFLDGSFVEIITPRNYAISVMKLLSELGDKSLHEYNSLVFATYSSLKQAKNEHESQMYEAVLSAKANTEQLEYELRRLYHGIREFLRSIQEQNDVNLLLQNHFEEYKKMSDRIYHPIKTMDSIHRYMAPIQNILSDILADEKLMRIMRERAMTIKKYDEGAEAEEEILSAIDYVLDAYQSVGSIINEIDRKHSTYTKSSIEKIQYLMTADQTIKGKLVELLKTYADAKSEERNALGDMFEKNIRINRQEFVDGKSLYHKSIRSRRVHTTPLPIDQDNAFSDLAMAGMLEQIKNGYPVARIRAYVDRLFAHGAESVRSEDVPLNSDADFILLILAIVRANDKGMPYRVQMGEGRIERNGYRIPNMIISKKGGKHHVE